MSDSDYDWITAHVRDPGYYIGISREHDGKPNLSDQKEDITDHEIRHFIGMCCKFNPNIIVALYSNDLTVDKNWMWLLTRKELFSSKKSIAPFIGFCTSQIRQAGTPTGKLGEKRKALVDKYGFDVKMAYHSVRVIRMMLEFIKCNGQSLNVHREDAAELLEIRNGQWSLSRCTKEVGRIIDQIKLAEPKCSLPDEPDYKKISKLCSESMWYHLKDN